MSKPQNQRALANENGARTVEYSRFFFEDGTLVLKAASVLFRIHWTILRRHSAFFHETIVLPSFFNGQGRTETNPIELEDVVPSQIEQFLSLFYPMDFEQFDTSTIEQWISSLLLASKWKFPSVREYCIKKLAGITSPAQRIALGRRHQIPEWLSPAYVELCTMNAPLSRDDAQMLGLDDVLSIWQVQYELFGSSNLYTGDIILLVEQKFDLNQLSPPAPCKSVIESGLVSTPVTRVNGFMCSSGPEMEYAAPAIHSPATLLPTPSLTGTPLIATSQDHIPCRSMPDDSPANPTVSSEYGQEPSHSDMFLVATPSVKTPDLSPMQQCVKPPLAPNSPPGLTSPPYPHDVATPESNASTLIDISGTTTAGARSATGGKKKKVTKPLENVSAKKGKTGRKGFTINA